MEESTKRPVATSVVGGPAMMCEERTPNETSSDFP